jgi:hypothetical protein
MMRRVGPALLLLSACASGGTRDTVPDSHDVTSKPPTGTGYAYIAKRGLGTVALAEGRGLTDVEAKRAIDKLADALDTCAKGQAQAGRLAPGAARVVADIDDGGVLGPPRIVLSPGAGAQANALLCLIAPFRMMQFSSQQADASARGIAIEATWGG